MRISLPNSNRSFSAAADRSLLDAALDAGLNLPHSCKGGNCGSCRARLLQGEVYYPHGRPLGLSDGEAEAGYVLLCQARARCDVSLETVEITSPEAAVIKRFPARIERAVPLSHDVMGLSLRLPAAEIFRFEPGQYLDIMLPGGRRRSFSIASPPHDARLLELHVRRVPGGEFSGELFSAQRARSLVNIEGPLGQFFYRHAGEMGGETRGVTDAHGASAAAVDAAAAPMLLVGGGTGLAPLLSILRHVIDHGIQRDMAIYWGVRAERDLYARATLDALVARAQRLRFVPVLSEPGAGWRGAVGWVHQAVLRDVADLSAHDVYAAGPPAMIDALKRDFVAHGVGTHRLFFDSFDYAPDSAERHRSNAATKS